MATLPLMMGAAGATAETAVDAAAARSSASTNITLAGATRRVSISAMKQSLNDNYHTVYTIRKHECAVRPLVLQQTLHVGVQRKCNRL